tara:strand:+ start:33405 stop:33980 length:576 start_codon:yes stop_codon:yes gene_type:complete
MHGALSSSLLGSRAGLKHTPKSSSRRHTQTVTTAGWFSNNKDVAGRDTTFEAQQEILRNRRKGGNLETEVSKRRAKVSGFMKKTLPKEEMDAIKQKNKDKANELSKEAFKGKKGFLSLPMASFGMPEFDGGERFDLRAPYADEGWVDPDDDGISNPFTLGGLFGGKKDIVTKKEEVSKPKKKKGFGGVFGK